LPRTTQPVPERDKARDGDGRLRSLHEAPAPLTCGVGSF
jgi:hypothetical protein